MTKKELYIVRAYAQCLVNSSNEIPTLAGWGCHCVENLGYIGDGKHRLLAEISCSISATSKNDAIKNCPKPSKWEIHDYKVELL